MKQKPGEGGVGNGGNEIFGNGASILHIHLLTGGQVHDGADGGLVLIAVCHACSHHRTVHEDGSVSFLGVDVTDPVGLEGGQEVVEPRDRGGEDPGQSVVGVAHVGDGVVEDQGTAGSCVDGVGRAVGVKCNWVVCRQMILFL